MRKSLYILVGGLLTGVLVRSFFDIGVYGALAMLCAVVASVLVTRSSSFTLHALLVMSALLLGVTRTEIAMRAYEQHQARVVPGFIHQEAIIDTEPDARDGYTVIVCSLLDATGGETGVRVRAKVPSYPRLQYGEYVMLSGDLSVPRAFETETGRVFDYPGYLMKEGVHYELKDPVVTQRGEVGGSRVRAWLIAIKQHWLVSVSRLIPEPGAALAGGLVVGAKQSLGEYWLEQFRVTGIIHIVVLSGYNLSLIALALLAACRRLPRLVGVIVGSGGVIAFALLVGASATVIRATVMAVLGLVAAHFHRPATAIRLLTLAALGMVVANPFVLVFDVGFQLSFLATLGLILYAPWFEVRMSWLTHRGGLRSIVAATLATQLTVLPLLLYHVGQLSLVALFVNVLVLPVVSVIMACSFLAGVIGFVSQVAALPFAWCAYVFLTYVFTMVSWWGAVPYASVSLPLMAPEFMVLTYVLLFSYTWYRYIQTPRDEFRAV